MALAVPDPAAESLILIDDDACELALNDDEARTFWQITRALDPATVSACPDCRGRVVAVMALVDLLMDGPPFSRGSELIEFAEDAPTFHLYVIDQRRECEHERWLDPLSEEWCEAIDQWADE